MLHATVSCWLLVRLQKQLLLQLQITERGAGRMLLQKPTAWFIRRAGRGLCSLWASHFTKPTTHARTRTTAHEARRKGMVSLTSRSGSSTFNFLLAQHRLARSTTYTFELTSTQTTSRPPLRIHRRQLEQPPATVARRVGVAAGHDHVICCVINFICGV